MSSKLNVARIFLDHFRTLHDHATKRLSLSDIITFIAVPMMFGILGVVLIDKPDAQAIGIPIGAFAIFSALLLNLLILIYSLTRNEERCTEPRAIDSTAHELKEARDKRSWVRREVLQQLFANISYAVLVAMSIVVILIILLFLDGWPALII